LLLAVLVVVGITATACNAPNDRPLTYLQAQPEYGLSYPGATFISNTGKPETMSVEGRVSATTDHVYQSAASIYEVVDWYDDKLTSEGWGSMNKDAGSELYMWRKDFVKLQVRFWRSSGTPAIADRTRYDVSLVAVPSTYDTSPLVGLRAVPELAIAAPGSSAAPGGGEHGRSIDDRKVRPASIERLYTTATSSDELIDYFESQLALRGWELLPPPIGHLGVGLDPDRVWKKGDVVAGLTTSPNGPTPTTFWYYFRIAERPDAEPGLPWE
jgi:hypothetical protein